MKEFTWDAIPDTRLLGAQVTDTLSCIYVHPHQHRLMSKRVCKGTTYYSNTAKNNTLFNKSTTIIKRRSS